MNEHALPNILKYTEAIEARIDDWTPFKRRTFALLSWLWYHGIHLYPHNLETIAHLPEGSFWRIVDAPDAATFGDLRALLRAMRVDVDWLAAGTDPYRYLDRWGIKHPHDIERRQSYDEIGRRVEQAALALVEVLRTKPPVGVTSKPPKPKASVVETLEATLQWIRVG